VEAIWWNSEISSVVNATLVILLFCLRYRSFLLPLRRYRCC